MKAGLPSSLLMLAAALFALLTSAPVRAGEGALLSAAQLPNRARSELARRISAARQTQPAAFERVARLRAELPLLDARKRGPLALIGPRLKALGSSALWPALERIAMDASPRSDLTDSAWLGWRLGLLEAVGALRDRRAEAVLRAVLEHPPAEPTLLRAAAVAYGKLGTDTAARHLIRLSHRADRRGHAAVVGMGHCRRSIVADRLAAMLGARPAAPMALLLARALGDAGSAWAWQAPVVAQSGEESHVRRTAAEALVSAYPAYDAPVRRLLAKAVLVVDHPATVQMIRAAQSSASGANRAALGRLAERVRQSPLRR